MAKDRDVVTVILSPEMRNAVRKQADKEHRTTSAFIRHVLAAALEEVAQEAGDDWFRRTMRRSP
jgi:hypothetical protein